MVRGEHDGGCVVEQSGLLARADNREDGGMIGGKW